MLSRAEFRGATLGLSGVLIVVLFLVSAPPVLPGVLLLQSLRFHIVLAGLALAAIVIISGARWRGLLVLLAVLLSAAHGAAFVQDFYARRTPLAAEPVAQFRFLSFNVLTGNRQASALVDAIIADPPDVALFMESPGIEPYLDRLATVFPYRIGCDNSRTCDISLHSRFPFEEGTIRNLPPAGSERFVTGRVLIEGTPVTVVGTHLTKPYFDTISQRELYVISQWMRQIEGPVVLAGDFNAAPWSSPIARLGREQQLIPGPWPAATWPVRLGPLGVPIDNVFTRGSARLLTLEAGESFGSNHRPLWADVALYAE